MSSTETDAPEQLSLDQAVKALEKLVNDMEQGEQPLETSLASYEQGIQLIRQCQQSLTEAEQKVQLLSESGELEDFDCEDDDDNYDEDNED